MTNSDLTTAKRRFFENISKGISVLVRRHGYSSDRAANLILDQIRQSDSQPSEDEVFRVMRAHGLGLDEASKTIIVANSLKRVQRQRGLSTVEAVDFLSSCLTTMKLLGTVEKQHVSDFESNAVQVQTVSSSPSFISEELISSSSSSSTSSTTVHVTNPSSESSHSALASTASNDDAPRAKTIRRMSSKKLRKTQRKNQRPSVPKEVDATENLTSDVDAKVAEKEKALHGEQQKNCKSPSAVGTRGKRGVNHAHMDDLEVVQGQPVQKRQRLDSI